MTILLVEDEDDLASLMELLLANDGHKVVRARDGQQALDLLPLAAPDLLLLDLTMPRMDGFDVLRTLADWPDPPTCVAMSSFHEFLPQAKRLGATGVLAKPFSADELEKAVDLAIERRARLGPHAALEVGSNAKPAPILPGVEAADFGDEAAELQRIERLHCLRVMQTEPEPILDEMVRHTAELLHTPIALVSIITADRQWWKAMYGLPGPLESQRGTGRDISFCTHAVAARAPLIVGDARRHPIFQENELVRQGVLTAYAGVPIEISGVGALGTLCVLDREARVFTTADVELLSLLAWRVAAEIEWREQQRNGNDRPRGTLRYLAMLDERYGIYNDRGFESIVGAIARRALLNRSSFGVAAFGRPWLGTWPEPENPAEDEVLVTALRKMAAPGVIIGRLEDRIFAAVLSGADQHRVDAFTSAVLREEARRRAQSNAANARAPAAVGFSFTGELTATRPLSRIRAELQQALSPAPGETTPAAHLEPHVH